MRRIAFHILFAGVTFSSGIFLSVLTTRHVEKAMGPLDALTSWISAEPLQRVGGLHACGPRGNFHVWNLSDGTEIINENRILSSSKAASRELEKLASEASEIIERQPILTETGRVAGERVVVRAAGVTVVEANKNILSVTKAASLEHLRWYEGR